MKNLKYILIPVLTFVFMSNISAQDFHTSSTKVEYEQSVKTIIITAKFFTKDLEKAVGISSSAANFDEKTKAYTANKLTVKINGSPVTVSFSGSQVTDKATRVYLKVYDVTNISSLEIKNSMLVEQFPDQQNLVTFDVNGVRKSFTARKGSETKKVDF